MEQLTPTQSEAIAMLIAGEPVAAVARTLGIDRSTIYHWRHTQPYFNIALNQGRARHNQAIFDGLQDLAATAVEALRHLLTAQDVSASIRLRAAESVLRATRTNRPEAALRESVDFETFMDDNNSTSPTVAATEALQAGAPRVPVRGNKVGRNQLCPCGSLRKFKRCCYGNPTQSHASNHAASQP